MNLNNITMTLTVDDSQFTSYLGGVMQCFFAPGGLVTSDGTSVVPVPLQPGEYIVPVGYVCDGFGLVAAQAVLLEAQTRDAAKAFEALSHSLGVKDDVAAVLPPDEPVRRRAIALRGIPMGAD